MKRLFSKKAVVVGLAAGLSLGVVGTALAYFTASGSGTGSASVGSPMDWGVAVTSDSTNSIYPGQGSETLDYTVTNNGSGNQAFSAATASVDHDSSGNVYDHGNAVTGCLYTWFTALASAPTPGFGTSIDPAGTATGTITVTMQDEATSQNACEGITGPDVTLSVS